MAWHELTQQAHEALTAEDDGRVCRDIPDAACQEQPQSFIIHVVSLAATKTGDGLADPKLVLTWLLGGLGAPAFLIGLLVPTREAGALLPQLFIAGAIRSLLARKWVWTAGSAAQGLAIVGLAAAVFTLQGRTAGWAIVGLLAFFAVARSACSVSCKDVLGKTVGKSTRGTATGSASTIAAGMVLAFGLALSAGLIAKTTEAIAFCLIGAGLLWLAAAVLFATLTEAPDAPEGGGNPIAVVVSQFGLLRRDRQFLRFIAVRGLLIATALAPPYLLSLAGRSQNSALGELGLFVVAAALAAIVSSYVWGRHSDASSRNVLIAAALVAAFALGVAAARGFFAHDIVASRYVLPVILYVLMIAYQGVRLGRSTHVVDMADQETRAVYTALSNTIIGLLLVLGGLFGLVAEFAGEAIPLGLFSAMCVAFALVARGLGEVQSTVD